MSAVSSESPHADADLSAPSANPSPAGAGATESGTTSPGGADFGANEWLVDELYQRYLDDPGSVDRAWWSFFADYRPSRPGIAREQPADGLKRAEARPIIRAPRVLFVSDRRLTDPAVRTGAEFMGIMRAAEANGDPVNSRLL